MLIILGAGASNPYGYPTGSELLHKILEDIENDQIYFPINIVKESNGYSLEDYKRDILRVGPLKDLQEKASSNIETFLWSSFCQTNMRGKPIKLSEIKEFGNLRSSLISKAPLSIDEYLRDNPSLADAAKCMLIYVLLKYEDKNTLTLFSADNWYRYLMSDLVEIYRKNPANLKKIRIITFNYDISLDYFIKQQILNKEFLTAEQKEEFISSIEIIHVYGNLYGEGEYSYGEFSNCSKLKNFYRFDKSLSLINNDVVNQIVTPQLSNFH